MDDLFGYLPEGYGEPDRPRHPPMENLGLQPWDGCDTYSEVWRAYCEAAGFIRGAKARNKVATLDGIERARGKEGRMLVEDMIPIVKADLAGEVYPRHLVPDLYAEATAARHKRASAKALETARNRR